MWTLLGTLFWCIVTACAISLVVERIDLRASELQLLLDGIIDRLNKLEKS